MKFRKLREAKSSRFGGMGAGPHQDKREIAKSLLWTWAPKSLLALPYLQKMKSKNPKIKTNQKEIKWTTSKYKKNIKKMQKKKKS